MLWQSRWSLALFGALALAGCDTEGQRAAAEKPGAERQAIGEPRQEKDEDRGHDGIKLTAEEEKAAGIKTEKVDWSPAGDEIVVTGTIQPNLDRLAKVAPRVPGRVVRVLASLGDRVTAGQPLAVLDSIEVGEARSVLAQAEAEAKVAEAAFKRAESLSAESIVPEKEYLRARSDLEKSRAAVAAAREKVRMLGVGPMRDGNGASLFSVAAPFAGTVVEKSAVPGALAEPAKPLFTVTDLTTVWIEASVFERDLPRLVQGAPATVTVAAWPGAPAKGRVTYIASLMDVETRTVKARVEVSNRDGRLRPGMFANVAIAVPGQAAAQAIFVPQDAVVLMDGRTTVFVRGERGFEPRQVQTGERRQGRVEVKDGIKAGEELVVAGTYELKAKLQKSKIRDTH
ncbi:MAG: efflux RND transporter periplasmic adaptor subunit [Pseudomonadota bacterium]